jgi:5-methylcytosine-specific restriction enzyme A
MPMRPPVHRPPGWRPAVVTRRSDPFYHSATWQATRLRVLRRDGFLCQLRLFGCRVRANIADHIVARENGGSDGDANLRACCSPCHNRRHPEKGMSVRD